VRKYLKPLTFSLISLLVLFAGFWGVSEAMAGDGGTFVSGNPSCQDVGYNFGFKINDPTSGTYTLTSENGELTGGAPEDSINSVTLSIDGKYFDWSSTLGMDAVIVKGGPDANLYEYSPEAFSDSGLHAPINEKQGEPYGLSHIEFCYDYELTASKSADGKFTRTYSWTIDKTVNDDTHSGFFGDDFSSSYDVILDQTVTDSDFKVTGTITVNNDTPFSVPFSISDSVNGTDASLNCPTYTLGSGDSVTCNFEADLGDEDPGSGTNTATITSENPDVDGTTVSDPYAFGEPTTVNGYSTVNVTDTFAGNLGSVSGDKTFEYDRGFSCPIDESAYTDGVYTASFPNTASIVETGQSADENVDLTCYMPLVDKDADTEWVKEYDWLITKKVDPDSFTGFAGDMFTSSYDVIIDQIISRHSYRAFGTITVSNPSPWEITVNVSDWVDGFEASVDCGEGSSTLTVAAESSDSCNYTVDLPDGQERTNTATVSFNSFDFTATAEVIFGDPIIEGFSEVDVYDYFDGGSGEFLGTATKSTIFEFDRDFTCPTDESLYTDGIFLASFPNIAEIDETGQQDDANVDLNCQIPAEAKVVKNTIEGPEDIGQFPFTFELYNPDGELVETQTLSSAGEVVFSTDLIAEGTWKIVEILPDGWVTDDDLTCTFAVSYPESAGEVFECDFENTEMSELDLLKLTDGVVDSSEDWSFTLYHGGYGGTVLATDSTSGDADGILTFGGVDLDPGDTYTVCEEGIPSGVSTTWYFDSDYNGTFESTIAPYSPVSGVECQDVGAGTAIPLTAGRTLSFKVNNQTPAEGCTPGFWKTHPDSWEDYDPDQLVKDVFAVPGKYKLDGTPLMKYELIEALDFPGGTGEEGAAQILLRAGVAAVLNASDDDVSYPLAEGEVISRVNAALDSGDRDTMLSLADELDGYNNMGCPLD